MQPSLSPGLEGEPAEKKYDPWMACSKCGCAQGNDIYTVHWGVSDSDLSLLYLYHYFYLSLSLSLSLSLYTI